MRQTSCYLSPQNQIQEGNVLGVIHVACAVCCSKGFKSGTVQHDSVDYRMLLSLLTRCVCRKESMPRSRRYLLNHSYGTRITLRSEIIRRKHEKLIFVILLSYSVSIVYPHAQLTTFSLSLSSTVLQPIVSVSSVLMVEKKTQQQCFLEV